MITSPIRTQRTGFKNRWVLSTRYLTIAVAVIDQPQVGCLFRQSPGCSETVGRMRSHYRDVLRQALVAP
jgi:hypothetical protein